MKHHFEECHKCTVDRYPGCQDVCPKGLKAKAEYEAERNMILKEKESAKLTKQYVRERITTEKRWKK